MEKLFLINNILFFVSATMIFWAMLGYPMSIKILNHIFKTKKNERNYDLIPNVTIMIVAHNEEKVIEQKLINLAELNYPKEKLKILVSSDNSSDKTNEIVEKYICINKDLDIHLYKAKKRKGKTNAQNEAQKLVDSEILVMSDANAMLDKEAIKELVSCFTSKDIAYVSGCLKYVNGASNSTSASENSYWDTEVSIREIEGRIQSITAGNGALYACRNDEYIDFPPIECHDSSMPLYYATHKKRAIHCIEAIAYEKAGENDNDEFMRKVRMNRIILKAIKDGFKTLNVFKYKWFSYFYFGHRTCRYLLWLNHFIVLITNIINSKETWFFFFCLLAQIAIYFVSAIYAIFKFKNKYLRMIHYYVLTVFAQWVGVYNVVTKKAKPTWDVAKSTR